MRNFKQTILLASSLLLNNIAYSITPKEIFPDQIDSINVKGVQIRKGTVAASIKNILAYNLAQSKEEQLVFANAIANLLPSLNAADAFVIFPLDFWFTKQDTNGNPSYGHRIVGILYAIASKSTFHPGYALAVEEVGGESFVDAIQQVTRQCTDSGICGFTPEDILKDGEDYVQAGERSLRKGTVAAYWANIKILQSLIHNEVERDDTRYQQIVQDMAAITEDLKCINYFDVFGS
jgi:hypothetical protein